MAMIPTVTPEPTSPSLHFLPALVALQNPSAREQARANLERRLELNRPDGISKETHDLSGWTYASCRPGPVRELQVCGDAIALRS